jgi:hypothetical protein
LETIGYINRKNKKIMGKKSAYSGESAKDRSINAMDKFISKNAAKKAHEQMLPGRRKDPNIAMELWPLKDQLEYWENRTDADRFDEMYSAYSTWYAEVKQRSGVYHATFLDFTSKLKTEMKTMWETKTTPKDAVLMLRKHGVY